MKSAFNNDQVALELSKGNSHFCEIFTQNANGQSSISYFFSASKLSDKQVLEKSLSSTLNKYRLAFKGFKNASLNWRSTADALLRAQAERTDQVLVHCLDKTAISPTTEPLRIHFKNGQPTAYYIGDSVTNGENVKGAEDLLSKISAQFVLPNAFKAYCRGDDSNRAKEGEYEFGPADVLEVSNQKHAIVKIGYKKGELISFTAANCSEISKKADMDESVYMCGSQVINATGKPGGWSEFAVSLDGAETVGRKHNHYYYSSTHLVPAKASLATDPDVVARLGAVVIAISDDARQSGYLQRLGPATGNPSAWEPIGDRLYFGHIADLQAHLKSPASDMKLPADFTAALDYPQVLEGERSWMQAPEPKARSKSNVDELEEERRQSLLMSLTR